MDISETQKEHLKELLDREIKPLKKQEDDLGEEDYDYLGDLEIIRSKLDDEKSFY